MVKLVRWVPREHVDTAIASKLVSHNESAMWVFDLDVPHNYQAGKSITKGAVLLRFQMDETSVHNITDGVETIDFESKDFGGEKAHPRQIIVKSNEPGVYGLGRTRQKITSMHVKEVVFATKKEVAKALGCSERDEGVLKDHVPPDGWRR